ncbi:hypothetical protein EJ05DRAFT_509007 [Pseudovirgaria hyperparasitica]|uniref:SMP domain-containing protein n=1 Tax=Pseudovirgaria hyperparasitica TaxID=470096 RepID=A0A6A6WFV1_9PEZI|nr:uncharacterized protein EJ05DRAFT_509007 [Pseudovirgaria hyperparasitica]KAF2760477.1 hypothetical protein EJ05DRAFT_509007 [Pseudovirgaria hyperparasitica]
MTSNLMTTEPGGEQTQYEAQHTTQDPPTREPGQMGTSTTTNDEQTRPETRKTDPSVATNTKVAKSEAMRFGQAMSEEGVGGMTTVERNAGSAGVEGGFGDNKGRARDTTTSSSSSEQSRREAGYDASNEQSREIGGCAWKLLGINSKYSSSALRSGKGKGKGKGEGKGK